MQAIGMTAADAAAYWSDLLEEVTDLFGPSYQLTGQDSNLSDAAAWQRGNVPPAANSVSASPVVTFADGVTTVTVTTLHNLGDMLLGDQQTLILGNGATGNLTVHNLYAADASIDVTSGFLGFRVSNDALGGVFNLTGYGHVNVNNNDFGSIFNLGSVSQTRSGPVATVGNAAIDGDSIGAQFNVTDGNLFLGGSASNSSFIVGNTASLGSASLTIQGDASTANSAFDIIGAAQIDVEGTSLAPSYVGALTTSYDARQHTLAVSVAGQSKPVFTFDNITLGGNGGTCGVNFGSPPLTASASPDGSGGILVTFAQQSVAT